METQNNQISIQQQKHGCLVQLLWFIFIGSWLGLVWSFVAWLFIVSIILMPVGFKMINMLPKVMLLRENQTITVASIGNSVVITDKLEKPQKPFLIRALWFIFIGWWLSGLWMAVAYFLCALIITFPIGAKMLELVPFITTLRIQ